MMNKLQYRIELNGVNFFTEQWKEIFSQHFLSFLQNLILEFDEILGKN